MKKAQKITILLRTAYIVLGLFITVFAIDKIIMPFYVSGDEVKVPNVVGLSLEKAKEIVDENNLDWKIMNYIDVLDSKQEGKILQQKPGNGKIVKEGRVLLLWVARFRGANSMENRATVEVPDLIGKTYAEAEQILLASNLNLRLINNVNEPDGEALVLEQSRKPGEKVPESSSIYIRIDMPDDPGRSNVDTLGFESNTDEDQTMETDMVTMPGLKKLSKQAAIQLLTDLGLKVGTITEIVSADHLPGSVISQSISAGIKVKKGEVIDLEISASNSDEEIIQ
ncbi:hypothetical protein MASR2M39_09320 [Ignavibacteriales bacterium]